MKCSLCKRRDAVYAIKTVLNSRMRELLLCPECIEKKEEALGLEKGALMFYAVPIALSRLDKDIFPKDKAGLVCPVCGMQWPDVKETRALGCGHCYEAFRPQLELVFRLTQGQVGYTGAAYAPPGGGEYLKYALLDIKTLSAELADSVRREDFEKAEALKNIIARLSCSRKKAPRAAAAGPKLSRAATVLKNTPAHMSGAGPYAHIALFTAARLARNLAGYNFCSRLDTKGLAQVSALLARQTAELDGFAPSRFVAANTGDTLMLRALAERYLIEDDPYSLPYPVTAAFTPAQDRAVVINDREHAKFYAFESGLNPALALHRAAALADELGARAPLGFSPWCGFHTARPGAAGTGLRLFSLVNLPALAASGRVTDVLKNLPGLKLASSPLNPEGFTLSGALHIISSVITLEPPSAIASAFEQGMRFLITAESAARIELVSGPDGIRVEDAAFRALGVLQNARSISYEETVSHLSALLLGLATGFVLPVSQAEIGKLFILCPPGHIAMSAGSGAAKPGPRERDILRATLLRSVLNHEKNKS